jgi:amidase
MNRRNFLGRTAMTIPAVPVLQSLMPAAAPLPPEADIAELQRRMSAGALTSRALTQHYLGRIAAIDKAGPKLNAVIEINPDALSIADQLDRERKSGKLCGPMHGIPVLIKDNIDTHDRMQTTAGSLALAGNIAAKDAFIVAQLRKAGAVILGKTNLSEWANFRSNNSSSGWSSRGGQTKNPHVLGRNPSGSSSGSGSAVAAALCAVAVGTETDGSIISPSSHCGVVGLKPTVGLVSRSGIIPISKTQDTAGPMTRSVRDAAILLAALTGVDPEDEATKKSDGKSAADYTSFLQKDALKGKRLGYEKRHVNGGNHLVTEVYMKAIDTLRGLGAELVEVELLKQMVPHGAGEFNVLLYEFKQGVNDYLARANAGVKTLAEVIAFNEKNADKTMPWFRQELLESSQAKGGLESAEYLESLKKSTGAGATIDKLMKDNRLDAMVGVSSGPATFTDLINGDYGNGYYFAQPAAMAGYPHVTVPMGAVQHLPMGLSFVGGAWQEGPLLGMAYAYEQATLARLTPKFR